MPICRKNRPCNTSSYPFSIDVNSSQHQHSPALVLRVTQQPSFVRGWYNVALPRKLTISIPPPLPPSTLNPTMAVLPSPTAPLKSVLVVGGCGLLGHHVVKLLRDIHPTTPISVLDLRTNVNRYPGVTYYDGDITDRASVDAVLAKTNPESVIDTVSPVHGLGTEIYFKVNVEGTRIVAEACKDAGVKAFVWTSTASIVFDGEHDVINLDETAPTPPTFLDPYTESKAVGEEIVIKANREGGMLTCALRLSGLFGCVSGGVFFFHLVKNQRRFFFC
jgi:hypothetical protein